MTGQGESNASVHRWYSRPTLLFVSDLNRSLQVDDPDGNELLFPKPG